MLVAAGILPVCGAALPDGPCTEDSVCKSLGLLTYTSDDGSSLHLDHEPQLQPHEREDPRAVCDPRRIQLLCQSCHARKNDLERSAERFVVCGPPGSGKTTWVEERRQPGDLVWDLDAVAATLFQLPHYPRPDETTALLLSMRNAIVLRLREMQTQRRVFIITASPDDAARLAHDIRARLITAGGGPFSTQKVGPRETAQPSLTRRPENGRPHPRQISVAENAVD
jgi:hypothetical protein